MSRLTDGITQVFRCGISTQVLDGLAHMHKRGVIHRDLKPELLGIVGLGCRTRKSRSKRSRVEDTNQETGKRVAGCVNSQFGDP